jgi:hypothetical protein
VLLAQSKANDNEEKDDSYGNNTTTVAAFKYMADPPLGYTRHVTDPPNLHHSL